MSTSSELLTAHRGLQRLCCNLPPSEAIAPGDLTGELFQVKTFLVTICQKYLDKGTQLYGKDNSRKLFLFWKIESNLMQLFYICSYTTLNDKILKMLNVALILVLRFQC